MSKKKSKKPTLRTASLPKTNDSPATAVDHYPETAKAFDALIMAYVEAEAVHRVAKAVGDEMENVKRMGLHPAYVRKPDDDDSPEDQTRATRLREALPRGLIRLNGLVDTYYDTERRFRDHVEKAKVAVDVAAIELDSQETPPLRRTSIAIRRALRNLSGSVPYAMTAGWAETAEPMVLQGIRTTSYRVSVWIEELRLLVRPRHTMPPPGAFSSVTRGGRMTQVSAARTNGGVPPKESSRLRPGPKVTRHEQRHRLAASGQLAALADALTPLQLEILGALRSYNAIGADDCVPKSTLCDKVLPWRTLASVAGPIHELTKLGLVNSAGGRNGGSWLTSTGAAVLQHRAEGQHSG